MLQAARARASVDRQRVRGRGMARAGFASGFDDAGIFSRAAPPIKGGCPSNDIHAPGTRPLVDLHQLVPEILGNILEQNDGNAPVGATVVVSSLGRKRGRNNIR